ncbi:MAG: ABC transporter permease [Treponema sp.]|nr:ABC transporter permease [Treponema sp.]
MIDWFLRNKWIFSVSSRFSKVDRKGRSKVTSFLASLGICFGVMTLIVVMSVMNGFQMSFIDSIMEVSSYHIRISNFDSKTEEKIRAYCEQNKRIKSITGFYEAQSLITTPRAKESVALIRAIDENVYEKDEGFCREADILAGSFNLSEPDSIILGASLARSIDAKVNSTVNLFALSGGNDVQLLSSDRNFVVKGIFRTGYAEINNSYVFINTQAGEKYFGSEARKILGVKLNNSADDHFVISRLKKEFPELKIISWRDYNKSFFGALRIEKNMLMFLVALIFIVVAVNIYNGMRRLVFERRAEISTLSALGAGNRQIKFIFILQGFLSGIKGAFPGLLLGLLLSVNSSSVFMFASKVMYFFSCLITKITNPENLVYITENPMYAVYAGIPARIFFGETLFITLFGVISPLIASWAASRNVLKMTVAEVLHNE